MATEQQRRPGLTVLVGGVAQLYQGDFDFGRLAVERLAATSTESHVLVEDLSYGAVAVSQRLEELRPAALVLVGAATRGRPPGALERRRCRPHALSPEEARQAVAEAVTGYVTVDLVLEVAGALGTLPPRTLAIELEPARTEVSERLSPEAEAALEPALDLARAEARRAPVLDLADRMRAIRAEEQLEPTPAVQALDRLLRELEAVDDCGELGDAFELRDILRSRIAAGETACDMTHRDWGAWWGLIDELDRIQPLEIESPSPPSSGSASSSNPRL